MGFFNEYGIIINGAGGGINSSASLITEIFKSFNFILEGEKYKVVLPNPIKSQNIIVDAYNENGVQIFAGIKVSTNNIEIYLDEPINGFIVINGTLTVKNANIEFQTTSTHIQWRYNDDDEWMNLIAISELKAEDGKSVELIVADGFIKWRWTGQEDGVGWTRLVSLDDLRGVQGEKGEQGLPGKDADMELVNQINEIVTRLSEKVSDLEVKLYYSEEAKTPSIVTVVDYERGSAQITPRAGEMVKAIRLKNIPKEAVKWQNKVSTFFGEDAEGRLTINSNPAFTTAPEGISFSHIGNLDPTIGIQRLDCIEDSYSILCNFDFETAAAVELEDMRIYSEETIRVRFVSHKIDILNDAEEVIKTIRFDCYNPN